MLTQRGFRDVMGRFGTGVVLVTAQTRTGAAGMAVNSFTSLSLDPPLIAFGAAHTSTTWPVIRANGAFAVTILADTHQELCRTFATPRADRFAGRAWAHSPAGHPVAGDALGWLDCQIRTVQAEGDHDLVIAHAHTWQLGQGARPLIFHAGRYTGLAQPAHAH